MGEMGLLFQKLMWGAASFNPTASMSTTVDRATPSPVVVAAAETRPVLVLPSRLRARCAKHVCGHPLRRTWVSCSVARHLRVKYFFRAERPGPWVFRFHSKRHLSLGMACLGQSSFMEMKRGIFAHMAWCAGPARSLRG